MREMTSTEMECVAGGISQDTQITSQLAIIGYGVGMVAGGVTMAPIAAVALIGTSLALTASYFWDASRIR